MKNLSLTLTRVANSAIIIAVATLSIFLTSCSQTVGTDNEPQVVATHHAVTNTPTSETVNDKSSYGVSVTFTMTGGTQQTYQVAPKTEQTFPLPDAVLTVAVDGVNCAPNVATAVQVPGGATVYVTWTGNSIVVTDTLEVN